MKLKTFLVALSIGFISTGAHANYQFNLNGSCEDIMGNWSGKGKATNWLLGRCVYHGIGTVSSLDSSGHFTVQVSADKDSGTFLCPEHAAQQLTAVCSNGVVTVQTEFGNLSGNFTSNTGSAQGTLTISPGLDAELSIQFFR